MIDSQLGTTIGIGQEKVSGVDVGGEGEVPRSAPPVVNMKTVSSRYSSCTITSRSARKTAEGNYTTFKSFP